LSDSKGILSLIEDWMPVEDPVFSGDQVRHDEKQMGWCVIPAKAGIQRIRGFVPPRIA
jgi:hypothetical protein